MRPLQFVRTECDKSGLFPTSSDNSAAAEVEVEAIHEELCLKLLFEGLREVEYE